MLKLASNEFHFKFLWRQERKKNLLLEEKCFTNTVVGIKEKEKEAI